MLELLAPILMQAAAVDCPSEADATGRYRIRWGDKSCEEIARQAKPPRKITPAEQRRIVAHFDGILVDGPSARWRWGNVVRGEVACFSVNSKNRMGGYAGWENYAFDLKAGEPGGSGACP